MLCLHCPVCYDRSDKQDCRIDINQPQVTEGRDVVGEMQGQGNPNCDDRSEERSP